MFAIGAKRPTRSEQSPRSKNFFSFSLLSNPLTRVTLLLLTRRRQACAYGATGQSVAARVQVWLRREIILQVVCFVYLFLWPSSSCGPASSSPSLTDISFSFFFSLLLSPHLERSASFNPSFLPFIQSPKIHLSVGRQQTLSSHRKRRDGWGGTGSAGGGSSKNGYFARKKKK